MCTFVGALVSLGKKTRIAWYVCANSRCKQQINNKEPAPPGAGNGLRTHPNKAITQYSGTSE